MQPLCVTGLLLIVVPLGLFSEDALAFLKMAPNAFKPKDVLRVVHIRLQSAEIRPNFKMTLIERPQMFPCGFHAFNHNLA